MSANSLILEVKSPPLYDPFTYDLEAGSVSFLPETFSLHVKVHDDKYRTKKMFIVFS